MGKLKMFFKKLGERIKLAMMPEWLEIPKDNDGGVLSDQEEFIYDGIKYKVCLVPESGIHGYYCGQGDRRFVLVREDIIPHAEVFKIGYFH